MATSLTSPETVLSKLPMNDGRQGREKGWCVFFVVTITAGPVLLTAERRACPEVPQERLYSGHAVPWRSPGLPGPPPAGAPQPGAPAQPASRANCQKETAVWAGPKDE